MKEGLPKAKKEEKRKNPLEGKTTRVVRPGNKQKTALLTTDGETVKIQIDNINKLELEMMLIKALKYLGS